MTPEAFASLISLLNISVSLLTLLGVAYAFGRILSRFDAVEKAIFGGDQQQGIFMRRAEAEILYEKYERDHEHILRRLDGVEDRRVRGGGAQ